MSSPKCVFEKEEADRVAITYTPRKFPMTITPTAHDFHTQQSAKVKPSFRMNTILADHTGVSELERISLEEKVEQEALLRIKELQENAYQEAYNLGLEEGRTQALQQHTTQITHQMGSNGHIDGFN